MKKTLNLILFTLFITCGSLHAQDTQQSVSWFQKLKNKITSLLKYSEQKESTAVPVQQSKNIDKEKNFSLLSAAINAKLRQTGGEDAIKNEGYVRSTAHIISILHSKSLKLSEAVMTVEDRKSGVENAFAMFLDDPTKKEASESLVQAWKKDPKTIVYYIDTALLGCLSIVSNEFDITQCNEVIESINNIHVSDIRQPQVDQKEINLNVLSNVALNKLGMTLKDIKGLKDNKSGITNEKFVRTAAKILAVLYRHLPHQAKIELMHSASQAPQSSTADKYMAIFMKYPTAKNAPDALVLAWLNDPISVNKLIIGVLPYFMGMLVPNVDQKTFDAIIQEIKNI